jgi:hypothetical protein
MTERRVGANLHVLLPCAVTLQFGESDGGKFPWGWGPVLVVAAMVAAMAAAATAFAYNDLTPVFGAVTAEKLVPAQDAIRAASTVVGTGTRWHMD